MAENLKKVGKGQRLRIPAAAYNAFVDSAIDLRKRQSSSGGQADRIFRQASVVLVKNDSGVAVGRFGVLGVDGPVIDPGTSLINFQNRLALSCVAPTSDHIGRFVVLAEPLANGAMGMAYAAGVCPCKINIVDADHRFAEVDPGENGSLISSKAGSATILWADAVAGSVDSVVWGVIRFGGGSGSDLMLVDLASGGTTDLAYDIIIDGETVAEDQTPALARISGATYQNPHMPGPAANGGLAYFNGSQYTLLIAFGERLIPSSVTAITDFQVNAPDLEEKTTVFSVISAAAQGDWTTVHEGTECPA